MTPPSKGIAAILVGKMKPKMGAPEGSPAEEAGESEGDEGYETAAEEIMQAIDMKDASALAKALKNFVSQC